MAPRSVRDACARSGVPVGKPLTTESVRYATRRGKRDPPSGVSFSTPDSPLAPLRRQLNGSWRGLNRLTWAPAAFGPPDAVRRRDQMLMPSTDENNESV
jgi:hypothetical protein